MINDIVKNIFRLLILVLIQVLIIKNIDLGHFINPFLYVLFIIMLPFNTPKPLLLILGFMTGLMVDMFYDTMGMHASACVLLAFLRPSVYQFFSPREGYESGQEPTIGYMGMPWFLSAAGTLIFIHHFLLFFIEAFRFSEFFFTFFRVLLSSIFTLLFCLISQYLVIKRRTN